MHTQCSEDLSAHIKNKIPFMLSSVICYTYISFSAVCKKVSDSRVH